ncbi:MAG: cysteine synthase A [Firmicutes bacterium]|nr:cysteine synthase A [Bacillota bacterium]MBQ5797009.1 cysteine synthase A [Bacillota bacterium]
MKGEFTMSERVYDSFAELIGHTPLLRLNNMMKNHGAKAEVLAKLEYFNPGGSVKDRVARQMIDDMEADGRLKPGGTIIEPTSGNTGIGLAAVCASRGYKLILTMPDTMSIERRKLAAVYGASVVLTPGAEGMPGAIAKAEALAKEIPGAIVAGQFVNPSNPKAHVGTTGPEIWEDTEGRVDAFVAGAGTGGTITGTGLYLKEKNPTIQIVAIEPETSAVLSGRPAGPHGLQGIGAGFIPEVLRTDVLDQIVCVTDAQALDTARELAKQEGILCGISAGAALYAALELASQPEWEGKRIVVLLPDTGERYLSTALFE